MSAYVKISYVAQCRDCEWVQRARGIWEAEDAVEEHNERVHPHEQP